ncbi:kinase-like domain-containing protein [Rhizophagus irregularis DAOM 181602=DAOM 197198]|nr:kinase-like domain-containing protein [Rhizophagus irregularis DAOM 181602=DAOM 197198]
MEPANINDENPFDPTPKLKSSPTREPQNIQECCRNCLDILCFKQIFIGDFQVSFSYIEHDISFSNIIESEKDCKLCGKSLGQRSGYELKLCSDCYLISSGYVESALTKKPTTPIIYLPCGNSELDEFLLNLFPNANIYDNFEIAELTDKIKNIDKYFLPSEINSNIKFICQNYMNTRPENLIDQSENLKILKTLANILNELKSNQHCYEIKHHIIKIYGVTKDLKLGDYMLVMQYASGGDLHNWLRKSFKDITWNKQKLAILWQISEGLETIHNSDFIHRDFHSGNILSRLSGMNRLRRRGEEESIKKRHQWQIGDLGLSQPSNNTSSNNEIYGVVPYIAPEIFRGSGFSKESDVYCMGCWDNDPKKRPTMTEIRKTFGKWFFKNKNIEPFNQAELKRLELISLEKLGPEFSENPHPSAIYTSRSLKSFISKSSSKYSSKDYASIELELDIDIESRPKVFGTKRNIEEANIISCENNGKHIKISPYSSTSFTDY